MAKIVDITEKLCFEENPVMQIGTLEVEVNADAETMLRLMGAFGNKGELQAVEEALNLIFKPEDVEKICNIKKGKKKLSAKSLMVIVEEAMNLVPVTVRDTVIERTSGRNEMERISRSSCWTGTGYSSRTYCFHPIRGR